MPDAISDWILALEEARENLRAAVEAERRAISLYDGVADEVAMHRGLIDHRADLSPSRRDGLLRDLVSLERLERERRQTKEDAEDRRRKALWALYDVRDSWKEEES